MTEELNRKICKEWGKKWFEIMFFDSKFYEMFFPTKNYFLPEFPDTYIDAPGENYILANEAVEFIIMTLYSGRKDQELNLANGSLSEADLELLSSSKTGTLDQGEVDVIEEKCLEMIEARFQQQNVEGQRDLWFGDDSEGRESKQGSEELSIESVSPREHLVKATLSDEEPKVRFTQEYFDSDSETVKTQSNVHSKLEPSKSGETLNVSPEGDNPLTLERHKSAVHDFRPLSVIDEVTESKRNSLEEEEKPMDVDAHAPIAKRKKNKGERGDQLNTVSNCQKSKKNGFVIGSEAVENMKKKLITYREELRKKEFLKSGKLIPFPAFEQNDSSNMNTPTSDNIKSTEERAGIKVERRPNKIKTDLSQIPPIGELEEP